MRVGLRSPGAFPSTVLVGIVGRVRRPWRWGGMSASLVLLEEGCFAGDLDAAAGVVIKRAVSGKGGFACFVNVHVAMTADRDVKLQRALASAWKIFPDGAPIAWLRRRVGATDARRIAGPDLMALVFEAGRPIGLRHFLYGSTPSVLEALEIQLRQQFPDVAIVGCVAPSPGTERSPDMLAEIARARPHIVWAAFGAPKQELWAADHVDALAPAVIVGVGAAFDFHAGSKRRAPIWMQRAGLEWLHRFATEPRRLGWRYLSTNLRFLAVVSGRLARDSVAGWARG
jgi:N-acetylglucosaminyldiphosphoundecaprenol N-acetyl-beta-D-mannosaminyltransferase